MFSGLSKKKKKTELFALVVLLLLKYIKIFSFFQQHDFQELIELHPTVKDPL